MDGEQTLQQHPDNTLTDNQKKIKSIFYLTYLFSQGNAILQNRIIQAIGPKLKQLSADIPENPPHYIASLTAPDQHTKKAGTEHDPNRFMDIERAWNFFYIQTQNSIDRIPEESVMTILDTMIMQDIEYQQKFRPRNIQANNSEDVEPDSIADIHASFVRKYVLKKQYPAKEIFDDIFTKLHAALQDVLTVDQSHPDREMIKIKKQLQKLITLWGGNHIGVSFINSTEKQQT